MFFFCLPYPIKKHKEYKENKHNYSVKKTLMEKASLSLSVSGLSDATSIPLSPTPVLSTTFYVFTVSSVKP